MTMMTTIRMRCRILAATLAVAAGSCADDDGAEPDLLVCGDGTVLEAGVCVPDGSLVCGDGTVYDRASGDCVVSGDVCAPGTILQDGVCLPDGSLVCGDGTVYDPASGDCVVKGDVCAPGTVLVQDRCVEEAGITADVEEAAEPNDGGGQAGRIPLPAEGADGIILHGCIDPYDVNAPVDQDGAQLLPDVDSWTITVSEPTLLDITSDGVGGLAAGFLVLPTDSQLQRDFWERASFSLVADVAHRQLFLPRAGDYEISMWDSRSLVAGFFVTRLRPPGPVGAGGPDACYYTTVSRIALPAPVDLPVGTAVDAPIGDSLRLYRFDPGEGELLETFASSPQPGAEVATTLLVDDVYVASSFYHPALGPAHLVAGFSDGEEVVVAVDSVFDFSLEGARAAFNMTSGRFTPQALVLGSPTTVTSSDAPALGQQFIVQFDAPPGDVTFTDLDFSATTSALFLDGRAFYAAEMAPFDMETSLRSTIRFQAPGRHYLLLFTPTATPGSTLDVTMQMAPLTPQPLTLPTAIEGQLLGPRGEAWYSLDLTDDLWLQLDGVGRGLSENGTLVFELFDPAGYGTVLFGLYPDYSILLPGGPQGQFFPDPASHRPWLVRLSDSFGAPDPAADFDFTVERRVYTDLGSMEGGEPIIRSNQTLPADDAVRYYVRGVPGQRVTVTVTPDGFDARVRSLSGFEFGFDIDEAGTGLPERFVTDLYDTGLWIAFDVAGDVPGTFTVDITAEDFPAYTVTNGTTPFTDACGAGEVVPLLPDLFNGDPSDEGLVEIPMPFEFSLFGDPVTNLQVASNGWINTGFATDFAAPFNGPMPSFDNVNAAIVPYWDDLQGVRLCRLDTPPDLLVLQWDGWLKASPTRLVQFQARLHADGTIEFVYGPLHMGDGGSATVGAENAAVSTAAQVAFDQHGRIRPNSSITLTPTH